MAAEKVRINRAPVMTLWAVVVAERLGHDRDTALTLGKAVARLNAESKGQRLGILDEKSEEERAVEREQEEQPAVQFVDLLGRQVPAKRTKDGLRAMLEGEVVDPASVEKYLKQKFKGDLDEVRAAMENLAKGYSREDLARRAYGLYEKFRPQVPAGEKGWGAAGELDLEHIRSLAE